MYIVFCLNCACVPWAFKTLKKPEGVRSPKTVPSTYMTIHNCPNSHSRGFDALLASEDTSADTVFCKQNTHIHKSKTFNNSKGPRALHVPKPVYFAPTLSKAPLLWARSWLSSHYVDQTALNSEIWSLLGWKVCKALKRLMNKAQFWNPKTWKSERRTSSKACLVY